MKRHQILTALTAISLLLCGCQKSADIDQMTPSQPEETLASEALSLAQEEPLTAIVRHENMPGMEELPGYADIIPAQDGFFCLFDDDVLLGKTEYVYHFDEDISNPTKAVLEQPASYDGYYYFGQIKTAISDDGFCSIVIMENHNDRTPEEWQAEWDAQTFEWEDYTEHQEFDTWICYNAKDGSLTNSIQVGELMDAMTDEGASIEDIAVCEYGVYLAFDNGRILRVDKEGKVTETCPPVFADEDAGLVSDAYFQRDRDGKLMYYQSGWIYEGEDTERSYRRISEFDEKNGTPGDIFYEETDGHFYGISSGSRDYRMYISVQYDKLDENTGAYHEEDQTLGIRDDGTSESVIDWTASDFPMSNITPLADGSFVAHYGEFWHLTRLHSSEVIEKQTITLGVIGSVDDYFVRDFNMNHEDLHLDIRNYFISDENGETDVKATLAELRQDVRKRQAPDLLLMEEEHAQFLKLGETGVLADLYPFMETDADVNKEAMLPNVLEAMQHPNSALYALPDQFQVNTIAVKSKFHVPENWTMDDISLCYTRSCNVAHCKTADRCDTFCNTVPNVPEIRQRSMTPQKLPVGALVQLRDSHSVLIGFYMLRHNIHCNFG